MTPDEQRQLFTKFFRSRDRAGPDPGGTGLGLVTARGSSRHGGSLAVESEPARARVFASRCLPSAARSARVPSSRRKRRRRGRSMLRDLLLEYLQMWDYLAQAPSPPVA